MKYIKWIKNHKPIYNQWSKDAPYGGTLFKTFGVELKVIKETAPHQVWTLMDAADGEYLVSGHSIGHNRIGFFITKKEEGDE